MIIFIRLILTAILIWFIYGETGPVTAVAFFLMSAKDEAMGKWMKMVNETLRTLAKHESLDELLTRYRDKP